jgi:hypothetical protein
MKVITLRNIGPRRGGRFGNQIFKYAFLKTYSTYYQLNTETSPWAGQYLFGHKDPQITEKLPRISLKDISLDDLFKHDSPPYVNVDLGGQYLFHTRFYRPFRKEFRALFRPTKEVQAMVKPGIKKLRERGKSVVGIHIRRGDYLKYNDHLNHWVAPTEWYVTWLEQLWPTLKKPVLFIASDDLEHVLPDFKRFNPVTSKELIPNFQLSVPPSIDVSFYPDYWLLTQCDYLAISNSTFSFSASMLNDGCKVFMRPDIHKRKLVQYNPWNSSPHIKR